MEALVPALVAALLAGVGDRPAWLAAILSDRFSRPGAVLLGVLLAESMIGAAAAAGGSVVGPLLTPNSALLLVAIALIFSGASALWRPRMPDRLESWQTGAVATAFLGTFSLALSDRTAFITFALAARGPGPAFAGVGAVLGATMLAFAAMACGERAWRRSVRQRLSMVAGGLLTLVGLIAALQALRIL